MSQTPALARQGWAPCQKQGRSLAGFASTRRDRIARPTPTEKDFA